MDNKTNIRDLFGAVVYQKLSGKLGLTDAALSMVRVPFKWNKAFPTKESWDNRQPNTDYMKERRNIFNRNALNNVKTLFCFSGTPSYAATLETRTYSVLNRNYKAEYDSSKDEVHS